METSPETRYLITGADGKEYGPVNAEELRSWFRQGRANASTRVRVENTEDFRTLAEFPEFADLVEGPTLAPGSVMPDTRSENALQMVQAPAIGLMIVAIIGLLAAGLNLLAHILGTGMSAMGMGMGGQSDQMEQFRELMSGTMGIVFNVIGLGVGVLTLVASLKMKKLENYGLVMAATICSMVPCISPCCCLGLPVGIWVLIVLSKPEVKNAFR